MKKPYCLNRPMILSYPDNIDRTTAGSQAAFCLGVCQFGVVKIEAGNSGGDFFKTGKRNTS